MSRTVSKTETYVGYCILLVLIISAIGIFLKQYQYHAATLTSAVIQEPASSQPPERSTSLTDLVQYAPDELAQLSPAESFGPENLSEKIDGKAELYFSAGFAKLLSQRFAVKEDSTAWMESPPTA